jgi:hypothetical protein
MLMMIHKFHRIALIRAAIRAEQPMVPNLRMMKLHSRGAGFSRCGIFTRWFLFFISLINVNIKKNIMSNYKNISSNFCDAISSSVDFTTPFVWEGGR